MAAAIVEDGGGFLSWLRSRDRCSGRLSRAVAGEGRTPFPATVPKGTFDLGGRRCVANRSRSVGSTHHTAFPGTPTTHTSVAGPGGRSVIRSPLATCVGAGNRTGIGDSHHGGILSRRRRFDPAKAPNDPRRLVDVGGQLARSDADAVRVSRCPRTGRLEERIGAQPNRSPYNRRKE